MSTVTKTVSIANVVLSTTVDQELDLETLSDDLTDARYDSEQYPGLVYRTEDAAATTLLFRSGWVISTGAPSIARGTESVHQTVTTLRVIGVDAPSDPEVTVQNIVSTGDLDADLNLTAVAIGLGLETVEYEPEIFPGLVYRLPDHDVVVLLFSSGKVVITGADSPGTTEAAIETVHTELAELDLLE